MLMRKQFAVVRQLIKLVRNYERLQSHRKKGFLVREIDPEVMVFDAVRLMDTYQVGALMVVEDEMLVGLIPGGIIPARLC